jgi:hypothetical protein
LNRKLLILDVVLVAVLGYAGFQFRNMYRAAKEREAAERRKHYPPVAVPQFPSTPPPSGAMATGYIEIPHKFLLDPSRNSDVAPEPPPPPPPPKPMPPLPVYHGQMNLGDGGGLFVILSMNKGAPHEAIHIGEGIGQFKLLSVNREGLDLEWDGKTIHKSLVEMTDPGAAQQQQADAAVQRAVAAPPPAPVEAPTAKGPGAVAGTGLAQCQANDSNPEGAVVNGMRKTSRPSPFGSMCYWEPVGGTGGR